MRVNAGISVSFLFIAAVFAAEPLDIFRIAETPLVHGSREMTPSVACNGSNVLVVWRDNRAAPSTFYRTNTLIYARRFDLSGAPLNAQSFQVNEEEYSHTYTLEHIPAVAACDGDYLVAWVTPSNRIACRLIKQDGSGALPIVQLTTMTNAQRYKSPSIAASRDGFLVAWSEITNRQAYVLAALLDKTGQLKKVIGLRKNDALRGIDPVVVNAGPNFFIAWRSGGSAAAARVTKNGRLQWRKVFTNELFNSHLVADLGLVADSRNCLLIEQTKEYPALTDWLLTRTINFRGKPGRPVLLHVSDAYNAQRYFGAFWLENEFKVFWREWPTPIGQLLQKNVSARGATNAPVSVRMEWPYWSYEANATPVNQKDLFIVWSDETETTFENGYSRRLRGMILPTTTP